MKREIKFRAWHKEAKEILYEDNIGDVFQWLKEGQPIEIMQFIGLKDKNGKEIYEGDIVFETGCGNNEIKWLNEIAAFGYKTKTGIRPIPLAFCCTIIGNIYENPELL